MRKQLLSFWVTIGLGLMLSEQIFAQAGALDTTFNPGTGTNDPGSNPVNALAIQSDGKILVGGSFTSYNGSPRNYIARANADGSLDGTFYPGAATGGELYALAIQNNGKIVVGGNSIARLNTDGSLDATFNTGSGVDDFINSIAIQSDGKIIIGGQFSTYNGVSSVFIARIDTNGTLDTSFHVGTGGYGNVVNVVALQSDGKILMGGGFTAYNGTSVNNLIRINTNGTLDNTFNTGTGVGGQSYSVNAIAIQGDGKILIGGYFTSYNGTSANYLVRLDTNGVLDPSFNTGTGPDGQVSSIAMQDDGRIIIGGYFVNYNGTPRNTIARLNANGSLDMSFNPGAGADFYINTVGLQNDGKVVIGGWFSAYNGTLINGVGRVYACTYPQPGPITRVGCPGTLATYSVPPDSIAANYTWTLPIGWSGNSDSNSIITVGNDLGGVISVTANNTLCGASIAQTDTIAQSQIPNHAICLVSVDSSSTYNLIIWEKTDKEIVDSYFVYRQDTTGIYTKIAAIPGDSLSEYDDTTARPNVTSYTYKLVVLDTCGGESPVPQSLFHTTIHLQDISPGNLQWTLYNIENTPNPVDSYNVYRDTVGDGSFLQIGTKLGSDSLFSDPTYNAYDNVSYVLDVNWHIACTPTRAVTTTRSNVKHYSRSAGIDQLGAGNNFTLSPNPASKSVTLSFNAPSMLKDIKILDMLGEIVYEETGGQQPLKTKRLNIDQLVKDIYMVMVETELGRVVKKLAIQ